MKKETRQLIPKMFVTGARLHTPSDRLECLSFSPTTLKKSGLYSHDGHVVLVPHSYRPSFLQRVGQWVQ